MTIEQTGGHRGSRVSRIAYRQSRRELTCPAAGNDTPQALRLVLILAVLGFVALLVFQHPASAQQAATVSTEQLYVRRGPGAEFPPFATLGRGDRVEVHEVRGEWARIVTGNGQTGYVRSDFLSLREK